MQYRRKTASVLCPVIRMAIVWGTWALERFRTADRRKSWRIMQGSPACRSGGTYRRAEGGGWGHWAAWPLGFLSTRRPAFASGLPALLGHSCQLALLPQVG